CVGGGGKTSPFTTATYKEYGDSYRHPPRTANSTLSTIDSITVATHEIASYWQAAQKARTNGVVDPFWRDWPLAEPYQFLTPSPFTIGIRCFTTMILSGVSKQLGLVSSTFVS
ncbi:hypothetical protein BT96DRAFT_1080441, partial [Gymnopus androsaceus JB14]